MQRFLESLEHSVRSCQPSELACAMKGTAANHLLLTRQSWRELAKRKRQNLRVALSAAQRASRRALKRALRRWADGPADQRRLSAAVVSAAAGRRRSRSALDFSFKCNFIMYMEHDCVGCRWNWSVRNS